MHAAVTPENLREGVWYRIQYRTVSGKACYLSGRFERMVSDPDIHCLWMWFYRYSKKLDSYYDFPIEWSAIVAYEEIQP